MSNISTSGLLSMDSEFADLLAECYLSTELFAGTILQERFYRPFDTLHKQIFDIIDDDTIPLAAIAAPRGIGKTSITNLAVPAKSILYDDSPYIVPVSLSASSAVQQSENLKHELLANPMVKKLFQPIKSATFSKEMWIANNHIDTCIMPRGAGQQIRGMLYRNHRPNLIIVDDLEDPEAMDNPDQRKKQKQWFYADLMNAIDHGRQDWRIIVLGTILHEDALLVELLEDDDWESVTLSICDDNLHTNAPNFMSDEAILKMYNRYKRNNQLGVFYREHRNMVVPTEEAKFRQEYFKYYGTDDDVDFTITEDELTNNPDVINVVIIDPAKTLKVDSADSAILGLGFNTLTKAIFIRDIVSDKFFPDELYNQAFAMCDRIGAKILGYEVTGLNEFISFPLKNAMIMQGRNYTLVELHARKGTDGPGSGKIARVGSTAPLYKGGFVYHRTGGMCIPLEGQLLSFPKSKKWDIMDVLGYITEMMDSGDLFFSPEGDANNDDELAAIEMKELEDMQNDAPLDYTGIV